MEYMSGFVEKRDCQLQQVYACVEKEKRFLREGYEKVELREGKHLSSNIMTRHFPFFFRFTLFQA